MIDFWISKNYKFSNFGPSPTLENKIDIFSDRVIGWQLEIAQSLRSNQYAGFGIISILFSYFEMIGQYHNGGKGSSNIGDFKTGFRLVYSSTPFTDPQLRTIYNKVRCGMYHNGYIKRGVLISGQHPQTFEIGSTGDIFINPHTLTDTIQTHFSSFISNLKNPANQGNRTNFEKMFNSN